MKTSPIASSVLVLVATVTWAQDDHRFADFRPAPVEYEPSGEVAPLPGSGFDSAALEEAGFPVAARETLCRLGFAVVRSGRSDVLDTYDRTAKLGLPPLYTADLFLHYHALVFARVLATLEDEVLAPGLERISLALLEELAREGPDPSSPAGRAALSWAATFAALGGDLSRTPGPVEDEVAREIALVHAAEGIARSPILGRDVDYGLFRPPRGYAQGPRLRYFRRILWAGTIGFRTSGDELDAAFQIARAVSEARLEGGSALDLLDDLAAVVGFFSGASADLGPRDVLGRGSSSAPASLERLTVGPDDAPPEILILPRTSLPDAHILARLAHPHVGTQEEPRLFPSALDIWAVFGSSEADTALRTEGAEAFRGYASERLRLAERFAPFLPFESSRWGQTLYWGFLHAAKPLLSSDARAPWAFAREPAWAARGLEAVLGAWVEGRLEGRSGSARRDLARMPPGGVLLPPPAFFARLEALARMAREGIASRDFPRRGLPGPGEAGDPVELLGSFERVLGRCREISIATREGRGPREDDDAFLASLPAELARLPVHPEGAGDREATSIAFTLHVRGRGAYHLVESAGPADDLIVALPGSGRPILYVGPALRWNESVVPEDLPEGPLALDPPPFARIYTVAGE
ncbi:MAG: DUF3160 domain-containing protein [Planctomycetes bacterium]|nr:DUF3160 domain-containing protein [Planctomycetota bacterium]